MANKVLHSPGRQDLYLSFLRVLTYTGLVVVAVAPLSSTPGTIAAVLGSVAAIVAARQLAESRWRWPYTILVAVVIALLGLASDRIAGGFIIPARLLGPSGALGVVDALTFGLLAFGSVLALRTLTSKFPAFAFVEASCLVAAVAYSFRGHRRYPFSQPQVLSDWAFSQGYDPRYLIMAIGVATLAALGLILLPRQYLARTIVAVVFILLFPIVGPQALRLSPWNPLADSPKLAPETSQPNQPKKKKPVKPVDVPPLPKLSIADSRIEEGNAGTTALAFTLTLSEASQSSISVNYSTTGGTATPDDDYTPTVGTLLIPPGQMRSSVTVNIVGDTDFEPDETVLVKLTHPVQAQVERDEAVGMIVNDDPAPPELDIEGVKIPEGNAGLTAATFGIRLSATSLNPVIVQYKTVEGSAKAGEDFHATKGTVTIPPGETHAQITINIVGDTTVEPDEDFKVELSNPVAAKLRTARATGTIVNDDSEQQPTPHPKEPPTIAIDDWKGNEGNSGQTAATFHLTLSHPTDQDVTVDCHVIARTAIFGEDIIPPVVTSLRFPKGTKQATMTVLIVGDTKVEPDETFAVELSNAKGATFKRQFGTGTILNDDKEPVSPELSIDDVTVDEGSAGTTPATFSIKLSQPTTREVEVHYKTLAETAEAGKDFHPLEGILKIPPGVKQASVSVEVVGDEDVEPNETFTLALSKPVNATLKRGGATATIRNDDRGPPLPRASIENVKLLEGNQGATAFQFTVKLSLPATREVSLHYRTEDGTALSEQDYRPIAGTLTFPPGSATKMLTVDVKGDTVFEADEFFLLELSDPTGMNLGRDKAMGVIINDDDRPKDKLPEDEFDWSLRGPDALAPAMLVRIRDDYEPVEGGYYLRTKAYSQLVGTRLLRSELRDADASWSLPTQRLDLPAQPPRKFLRDIAASVFLIGEHDSLPGLVQSVLVEPQTNPSPSEFSAAFRVTSQVLAQDGANQRRSIYAELAKASAGSASWDDATRKEYLAYPPDPRYRELALQISNSLSAAQRQSPLARALAIRKWMEENLTYDYNPAHERAPDRTTSFLFGDRRGYCIHFAHAMTFLLRAQDIPARLAVGYRASLDRAGRRGSFIAYNNDKHAWAEMYLDQIGWIVVESAARGRVAEADPDPDPRELDRFLNLVGEVPKEVLAEEETTRSSLRPLALFGPPLVLLTVLLTLYAVKIWRALSPRVARQVALPRVGYRAALDRLAEIGYRRHFGETWEEFAFRLRSVSPELARLTEMHVRHVFRSDSTTQVTRWWEVYSTVMRQLAQSIPAGRRWLGLLNPISWIGVR